MGNPSQYEKMMEAKNKLDDDHGWFRHTHLVSVGDYKRSIRPFEPEQLIQDMSLLSLKYLRCPVCGRRFLSVKSYSQYKNSRFAFTGAELECRSCESTFKTDPFIYGAGTFKIDASMITEAYFVNDTSELDQYNTHEKDSTARSYQTVHPKLASLENVFTNIFSLAFLISSMICSIALVSLIAGWEISGWIIVVDLTALAISGAILCGFKIVRWRWETTHGQKFRSWRNTKC